MIDRLRQYVQGFTRNLVEIFNPWSYVWVDCWLDFILLLDAYSPNPEECTALTSFVTVIEWMTVALPAT